MPQIPPLLDTRILRPAETALALELVSKMDLLRLKTIARLHARGLPPDVCWEDVGHDRPPDDSREIELPDPSPDPERLLVAQQELTAIGQLFCDDAIALQIVAGLGEGLSAEEILEAAKDLGMDPEMKESAAFRGLTYPSQPQLSDFFELEFSRTLADFLGHGAPGSRPLRSERTPAVRRGGSKRRPRPRARATAPRERKDPDGK